MRGSGENMNKVKCITHPSLFCLEEDYLDRWNRPVNKKITCPDLKELLKNIKRFYRKFSLSLTIIDFEDLIKGKRICLGDDTFLKLHQY